MAYAANQFFTSRTIKESAVEVEEPLAPTSDLEKMPTRNSVMSIPMWKSIRMIWRRQTEDVSKSEKDIPGTWTAESTGINDPSRLLRRSTDRSLAARSYVPPRSTVQFIPGAYDMSSAGPSYFSAPSGQIPGSQSYDFAPGTSAIYDGPYSQVSQMSGSYSPVQRYQPYRGLAEAYGTPQRPSELGDSFSAPRSATPVVAPLPKDTSEEADSDDLYSADDELGVRTARAVFDFEATDSEDLSFKAGDILTLLPRISPYKGWAYVNSNLGNGLNILTMESHARIGTNFGVVPRDFIKMIDPPQGSAPATSINYIANSQNSDISAYETDNLEPSTSYKSFSQEGDDIGYRPDGPDSFGLPPEGISSSFTGVTLEEPSSNSSSIPASRRFGTVFGGLDEIMMSGEASGNTRLEPIPEEGSVVAESV